MEILDDNTKTIDVSKVFGYNHTNKMGGNTMIVQRQDYLNKLIAFKDKQLIKIITGIRRCGKSTLLELYQQWLRGQGVDDSQMISINFEDMNYSHLQTAKALLSVITALHSCLLPWCIGPR